VRVAHYIQPLATTRLPERHLVFDTEATSRLTVAGEQQTFALACTEHIRLSPTEPPQVTAANTFDDPRALWQSVAGFTARKKRTVVWCHGLAYDLRISQALRVLPALGYRLDGIVLEHTSSWAKFTGDDRTLLFCDLTSWLPAALSKIAADLGLQQASLPKTHPTPQQLLVRCQQDVAITRQAVCEILNLIQTLDLGSWQATGAGQSYNAWRRRHFTTSPLVHDSEDALEAERRAMWTGRCEAWQWGTHTHGSFHEYDLRLAYCDISRSNPVPFTLVGRTHQSTEKQMLTALDRYSILAECEITTTVPALPASEGKRIHWPTGTYRTTLWDPELRLAYQTAQRVKILRAWLYRPGTGLQAFAGWLFDAASMQEDRLPPIAGRMFKHWSRTLIGRFGLRYRSWEPYATLPDTGLRLGEIHDTQSGERVETLHVGNELLTLADLQEGADSVPQITGWVMAECRRRLWQLTQLAGEINVLYMDTDCLIVSDEGARRLDAAIAAGRAWTLVHKATYRRAVIHGPRQLELAGQRRVAGVPLTAAQVAPGVYEGETFRGLPESLRRCEGETVTVEHGRWELTGVDHRREHLPGGLTAPHRVA